MAEYRQMLSEVAATVGGQLLGPDVAFDGINTDTRNIKAGQLFVALKGPNFDGHDFVRDALNKGSAGVMVSQAQKIDQPQIIVSDTQWALGQLAAAWRNQFSIPVVAVTGSNGKTTVKEMIAAILQQQGTVLSTRGNLNNEIGVPLTLLRLNTSHDSAVIEEGASHAGDIAYLTRLVSPTVAVVTNAAGAHLEGFGSLDVVANTKGEIFENLPENGTAIINADDQYVSLWQSMADKREIVTFGMNAEANVKGALLESNTCAECHLNMTTPIGDCVVSLHLPGQHNAMNALAAAAVAIAVGVELDVIKKGLETVKPVPGRLQWKNGINGAQILDDTYNANPASLAAALKVLSSCPGDHYLALGDMAELGDETKGYHQRAGHQARSSGVHRLYAVGEYARFAAEAFGDRAWHFSKQEQLVDRLREDLTTDVTLLVKGSRSSRMDKVVEALEVPQAVGSIG
jgi:UDP-N-acetylmuramoyl-tripeptide--D-alanyl-D-alanine ligase